MKFKIFRVYLENKQSTRLLSEKTALLLKLNSANITVDILGVNTLEGYEFISKEAGFYMLVYKRDKCYVEHLDTQKTYNLENIYSKSGL